MPEVHKHLLQVASKLTHNFLFTWVWFPMRYNEFPEIMHSVTSRCCLGRRRTVSNFFEAQPNGYARSSSAGSSAASAQPVTSPSRLAASPCVAFGKEPDRVMPFQTGEYRL